MRLKSPISSLEPTGVSHLLIFSPSNYIQVPNPSFSRVLIQYLEGGAPKSTLCLLDKVQSKAIRLINNFNLTKSLQPLSHRRLVADLSIFYRYFHRHCSQEIRGIIPVSLRRVRTTRSSTHSQLFEVSLPTPTPRTSRNHQFQVVRMKLVLKSCCSIQPTWTIFALQSYLTNVSSNAVRERMGD